MSPYFLLVPILLPILGGLSLFFLKIPEEDDHRRNVLLETIVLLTSAAVWLCLLFVRHKNAEVYSFIRGFSIEFRADGLGSLFAGMVSLMWPLVMLYTFDYMRHDKGKNKFLAFYVMTYGVTVGVAFAANMTTLYAFFEMLTLVTIPLVSHYKNHDSMFAGRKYAAYTIGGSGLGFFTVVISTLYGENGNFLFGGSMRGGSVSLLLALAFAAGFFGFGAKAAVFPLHGWLPTASVAPTPVTALLHAVAVVNAGVFAVMRLVWYVFGPERLIGTPVQVVCLMAAVFTLVFAAAMALKERHFKRRLAYSTVSNLSYMLFGVMLLSPAGYEAGMLHMLFHGIIKMSLFLCAGAFMHNTGNSYIYQVNGVGKRMPVTFVFYTLGGLSLTGVPLFCGFISKWNLVMAGLSAGTPWGIAGVAALIVSAFLCAMYTLSVSVRAFFPIEGTDWYRDRADVKEASLLMLAPIAVFGIANVLLGIWPQPVVSLIHTIASGGF